jgi:hypothetical protein
VKKIRYYSWRSWVVVELTKAKARTTADPSLRMKNGYVQDDIGGGGLRGVLFHPRRKRRA